MTPHPLQMLLHLVVIVPHPVQALTQIQPLHRMMIRVVFQKKVLEMRRSLRKRALEIITKKTIEERKEVEVEIARIKKGIGINN